VSPPRRRWVRAGITDDEQSSSATNLLRLLRNRLAARRVWWWAPLAISAVYLITLAVQFGQVLASTYLNADAASAPVIGQLFGGSGHPQVFLGHLGWFSSLLFELGTRWMPLHRQIWEVAPYGMALAAAALVGWGAWRVAGRWAGAIAATIIICASPHTLSLLLALNDHAPTWFTLALLGAFLVLLELRADTLTGPWLGGLAVVVGVLLGANAASDVLLAVAGAVPFLLAIAGSWALDPGSRTRRAGAVAAATVLVAVLSDLGVHALMSHENVMSASDAHVKLLAGAGAISGNFRLWWESVAVLGNGDFFGQLIGFSTALALACAALALAAVLVAPRIAWRELAEALARHRSCSRNPQQTARLAWGVFWGSSLVLLSAAFILSSQTEDVGSSRYLVGVIYAAAALVPLLGSRSTLTRVAVTAGATLYAFVGWLSLAQQKLVDGAPSSPSDRLAGEVAKIAGQEHLTLGYAGYWDAAPITWATHLRVKVFPVDECDGNQHLCGFELHFISSWYSPKPATMRTFLLSDPAYPASPSAPTPDLGAPIAVHQIGAVTMYVYPYNIATRFFAL
jgi:hypothetical protein